MQKAGVITRGVSLPREINEELVKQARREDRSVSNLIARAVKLYLEEKVRQEVRT